MPFAIFGYTRSEMRGGMRTSLFHRWFPAGGRHYPRGAMPLALAIGTAPRRRTIWIDSVANAEEFSMAGMFAEPHADLWLTRWREAAERSDADYAGAVL